MDKFRAPDPFSFDGPDVAQRWIRWEMTFRTYFKAAELKKKPKDIQVAILLNNAGPEAQEIHEHFEYDEELEDERDIETVFKKFQECCNPRKNTVYERYKFRCRTQTNDETIDKWVKELKTMSVNCEFGEQESSLIRDQVVFGVRDDRTKERMLRETDLPLKKAMEICRAAESTKTQMKEMSKSSEDPALHELKTSGGPSHASHQGDGRTTNSNDHGNNNASNSSVQCFRCSGFGHRSRECGTPPDVVVENASRGQGNRGRSNTRGNRGRRSHGRGRGRFRRRGGGYNVNEIEVENEQYYEHYEDQFQSMTLDSVTVERSERGRAPTRGNKCGRSHGCEQAHKGPEEVFEEQFSSLNLD